MVFPNVFSQVIQLIPRTEFESIVARHRGNKGIRSMDCWTWLGALLFGQFSCHDSIRAIERVFALDSTTIELCLKLCPWAPFHHEKIGKGEPDF